MLRKKQRRKDSLKRLKLPEFRLKKRPKKNA